MHAVVTGLVGILEARTLGALGLDTGFRPHLFAAALGDGIRFLHRDETTATFAPVRLCGHCYLLGGRHAARTRKRAVRSRVGRVRNPPRIASSQPFLNIASFPEVVNAGIGYTGAMKVIKAAVLGCCMGVKRAMDMALAAAEKQKNGLPEDIAAEQSTSHPSRVWTLGPLIHNPQAIADLAGRGVAVLRESDFGALGAGDLVIIRAHGAPPETLQRIKDLGARIEDATCPRVLASQKKASSFHAQGFALIIAGDRLHGEVTGILGHAPGAEVVCNASEAEAAARRALGRPLALIAQTTIRHEEYQAIRAAIEAVHPDVTVINSICPATEDRQAALAELAQQVDAIIVVGGKDSANTRRLYLEAVQLGKRAWHIETVQELPKEIDICDTVGLTAGASTPTSLVEEVEQALLVLDTATCVEVTE